MRKKAVLLILLIITVILFSSQGLAGRKRLIIIMTKPHYSKTCEYQDDNVYMQWNELTTTQLRFRIKNLSPKRVYIVWGFCGFVGFDGRQWGDQKLMPGLAGMSMIRPNKEAALALDPTLCYREERKWVTLMDGTSGYVYETIREPIMPPNPNYLVGRSFGALLHYDVGGLLGLGAAPQRIYFEFVLEEEEY